MLCCFITAASASEVLLNLDEAIKTELLPSSDYFQDLDSQYDVTSINQLSNTQWQAFNRKQFRFGLTSNPIWVRTTLVTSGKRERNLAFDLHGIIDHVQLQISDSDGKVWRFKFGKGSQATHVSYNTDQHFNISKKASTDHIQFPLSPNKTYKLLLRINSSNAVIGSFRAVDHNILDSENQTRSNGVIVYLFLFFLVVFYSSAVYVTTHDKAFIFYTIYVLSVTGYLLNGYGFLESWLGITDLRLLQNLLIFNLASAILSMLAFCKAMIGETYHQFPSLFKSLYRLLLLIGITTLCLIFLVPYDLAIRFLIAEISLAMVLSPFLAFYRPQQQQDSVHSVDTRLLRLRTTLLVFTVVGGIHVLTRLGIFNVYWFTNYILFIFIFIEVLLFAVVIVINISNDKQKLFRETFFDRQSKLPNQRSLKAHFSRATQSKSLTLIYFWVAGLDKLEIAQGTAHYRIFIADFGHKLSAQLNRKSYVVPCAESNSDALTLFHTGKNNFAMLCERLNYKSQQSLHNQITDALELSKNQYDDDIDFKVFIGADGFYPTKDSYETVTQNCLLALAQGIKNNTNIKYYDDSIRTDKHRRKQLIGDFEKALSNNELFLLWQPQHDVKSNKILGLEVFSRWQHPEHGLVLPDTFIPLIEKSNRVCQLTRWVIKEVFAALPNLHKHFPDTEVSINLSPYDLVDGDLINFLDEQLVEQAHLASYIVLEISESMMIDDYSVALENIKALQNRGFKVSIENFGSGLASFAYLQTIPTNELKIDKSFSDRFEEPKTYAILNNIIKLSQRLNIRLVIEGLETKQQVDLFTSLGVGRLQGWAISKPMTLNDLLNSPNYELSG